MRKSVAYAVSGILFVGSVFFTIFWAFSVPFDPLKISAIAQVPTWATMIILVIGVVSGVIMDKTEPQEDETNNEEPLCYGNKVLRGDRIIWPL